MNSRIRFVAAILALSGVLFAQLAIAAYACPFAVGIAETAGMPQQEGNCGGMPVDPDQPALCQAHCQQGNQSLDKPPVALPDPGACDALPHLPGGEHAAHAPVAPGELPSLLARATAPPLAVRHCCLRI